MDSPSAPLKQPSTHPSLVERLAPPAAVVLITLACFLPTTRNGFVNWDDPMNFLQNADYQSASWEAIAWAFTTRHGGHYQPLNWLTFIADHALTPIIGPSGPRAGDDPSLVAITPKDWPRHPPSAGRFHQTQAILHALATLLVYFLAKRLLGVTAPNTRAVTWGAEFAALVFGLHPLRVESVAWASARTDILAQIFMTLATLAYLKNVAAHPSTVEPSPGGRFTVALFMMLALGSKVMAITLPIVLLVVDAYLGRIRFNRMASGGTASSFPSDLGRMVAQKAELFALAIGAAIIARWAQSGAVADLQLHSWSMRAAQLPVSLAFYPYKTLLPFGLSPLYEFPVAFGWSHPRVLGSLAGIFVALILAILFLRSIAVWATILAYVTLIAPVTGLIQRGPQMVADRYSYISCIPLALLAGGIVIKLTRRHKKLAVGSASFALVILFAITQRQIGYWHDSVGLWERAIKLDRTNATAYACLGAALDSAGETDRALDEFKKSVALRHTQPDAWFSLGNLYQKTGRDEEAIQCYSTQLELQPRHQQARMQLCMVLSKLNRLAEAEPHLRLLLADPARDNDTLIRHMLADACAERGEFDEALRLIDDAIRIARARNKEPLIEDLLATRENYLRFIRQARTTTSQPSTRKSNGE